MRPNASHCFFADLFRADSHRVFDWKDKHFAVANLAGFGRAHYHRNSFLDHVSVTTELEQRLRRWLIGEVGKRAKESEQETATESVAEPRAVEY